MSLAPLWELCDDAPPEINDVLCRAIALGFSVDLHRSHPLANKPNGFLLSVGHGIEFRFINRAVMDCWQIHFRMNGKLHRDISWDHFELLFSDVEKAAKAYHPGGYGEE